MILLHLGISVIENARVLVFDAASAALTVKLDVVKDATSVDNVPVILNFETPSSLTVAVLNPAGKEPVMISNVTFPAESGSVASISIVDIVVCSEKEPKNLKQY
jgi:hypothetical protein